MSNLWHIEVLDLVGCQVRLLVRSIHPDAAAFPTSKEFALRLIADRAFRFDESGAYVALGPLGEALAPNSYWNDEVMRQSADGFIASVHLSDVQNAPFDEESSRRQIEARLRARGLTPGDSAWQAAFDEAWNEFWQTPSNLPSAIYTIRVTDPRWIAHLAPAQQWDSAAYG